MTKLIFSFDTEDYINPEGADGILATAQLLRANGIKGCFNMVGRMALQLREWGRQDVIDELRNHHEVSYHSTSHSMHPTINEYTDFCDIRMALKLFKQDEARGIQMVKDVFGVDKINSACPPGSSHSYIAHYGYSEMGIPTYNAGYCVDENRGNPISTCNIYAMQYGQCLEFYLPVHTEEQIKAYVNEIAEKKDLYIFYHHPQMAIFSEWCDELNFNGDNTPRDQWKPSQKWPEERRKLFYERFAYLISLIKNDPRFEITTYAEVAKSLECTRTVTLSDIPALRKAIDQELFPVTLPESLSLCDILQACRSFLTGKTEHVCKRVYGFYAEPFARPEPVTVTKHDLINSLAFIPEDDFLPEFFYAGSIKLGPADWLRAALAILDGEESYTVKPGPWQIDMDQFPKTKRDDLSHIWIHSPLFTDQYTSDRMRLQSWTFRMLKGTARKPMDA